jgi:hypothetical protein
MTGGNYTIKCVKAGGHSLTGYGQHAFSEGEELDLLDAGTPDSLRAANWAIAKAMCEDSGYELAQLIAAGDFEIASSVPPEITLPRFMR